VEVFDGVVLLAEELVGVGVRVGVRVGVGVGVVVGLGVGELVLELEGVGVAVLIKEQALEILEVTLEHAVAHAGRVAELV
jgi:hypothetical protein